LCHVTGLGTLVPQSPLMCSLHAANFSTFAGSIGKDAGKNIGDGLAKLGEGIGKGLSMGDKGLGEGHSKGGEGIGKGMGEGLGKGLGKGVAGFGRWIAIGMMVSIGAGLAVIKVPRMGGEPT
jgi:hypothetical protein